MKGTENRLRQLKLAPGSLPKAAQTLACAPRALAARATLTLGTARNSPRALKGCAQDNRAAALPPSAQLYALSASKILPRQSIKRAGISRATTAHYRKNSNGKKNWATF